MPLEIDEQLIRRMVQARGQTGSLARDDIPEYAMELRKLLVFGRRGDTACQVAFEQEYRRLIPRRERHGLLWDESILTLATEVGTDYHSPEVLANERRMLRKIKGVLHRERKKTTKRTFYSPVYDQRSPERKLLAAIFGEEALRGKEVSQGVS